MINMAIARFSAMVLWALCFGLAPYQCIAATFYVTDFGARGNGITDNSVAFGHAWKALCGDTTQNPELVIPQGQYLLKPISFNGPCRAPKLNIQVLGTISAPNSLSSWNNCPGTNKDTWILFYAVNGLNIGGSGKFDGQGHLWWQKATSTMTCNRPAALGFYNCNYLQISGTTHVNSPARHIAIGMSQYVDVNSLHIYAPEDSPNTDGIDIGHSSHVRIRDTVIQTGDDCVAIGGVSSDVNVTGVQCGPGHGISIGGLGANGQYNTVDHVRVTNCNFTNTANGARIKTWPGGSGHAKSILFQQIYVSKVQFPIIIDQYYCGGRPCQGSPTGAVQVSDVTFRNIQGSAATSHGIMINCSEYQYCTGIVMDHVTINAPDVVGICHHAKHPSFIATSPLPVCD